MLLEKTHCAGNPDSDSQVQSENAWTVGSLLKTYISNLGGHPLHYLVISFFLLTSLGPYFFSDLSSISVQFSRSVMSNSLRPHKLQRARPPCPSPTPGVHSNSCPSSRECHPAISSSVVPFSSWPQSLPASESFPMSQLLWGGQSIGVSAFASVLPKNTQDWSICTQISLYP